MSDTPLRFFIYCRKSSEDNRQAASIPDQLRELEKVIDRENLRMAADPFTEEKSAKAPGRPVFDELLSRIEDGEANALLCWDIDRLYRNPVDGGRVRWLLQNRVIREIRTPFRRFRPQDAGLLMGVEGGRAVEHIITLRKGVLRGFRGKLEKGWRPGVAPPGYLNDTSKKKGQRTIIPDPERFDLIRRAWDLLLNGNHSLREIQRIADEEWGLRSRKTKKQGGRPYATSTWHNIFTMPFYYGKFRWKEPGTDEYRLYDGAHEPMITKREFDRVQLLLGHTSKSRRKERRFAFRGLIHCGECGASITAERKYQVICSECNTKFSALNRDACRKCQMAIEEMTDPTHLRYTYYRCTKQRDRDCSQEYIRGEELENQLQDSVARVAISEEFKDWAIRALDKDDSRTTEAQESTYKSLEQRQQEVQRKLEHITDLVVSPDTDWELISREELKRRKRRLQEDLEEITDKLENRDERHARGLKLTKETFHLASRAAFWAQEATDEEKRELATGIASNIQLIDGNVKLEVKTPFRILQDLGDDVPAIKPGFEPDRTPSTKENTPHFTAERSVLLRAANDVRTYWLNNPDGQLPSLPSKEG